MCDTFAGVEESDVAPRAGSWSLIRQCGVSLGSVFTMSVGCALFLLVVYSYVVNTVLGNLGVYTLAYFVGIAGVLSIVIGVMVWWRSGDVRPSYVVFRFVTRSVTRLVRGVFRYNKGVFLVGCFGVAGMVYVVTENVAAATTVLYASIIFGKEVLLSTPALLRFTGDVKSFRSDDLECLSVSDELANIGGEDASFVRVRYRAYDESGTPLTKISEGIIQSADRSLETGETIDANDICLPLPLSIEQDEGKKYIHVQAEDTYGVSLVPTFKRLEHTGSS